MTIKREINGVMQEIELTKNELYNAFCEQQQQFDTEDVKQYLDAFLDGNEDYQEQEVMEKLPEIVRRYRHYLGCQEWWDSAEWAVQDCMSKD